MKYKIQGTARISGVDPDDAGKELERIRTKNEGKLTARNVVSEARAAKSPLHPVFEWDNKKAGTEYRLNQARTLIRAVRVIHEKTGEEEHKYVHIQPVKEEKSEGYYQDLETAVQNIDEYQLALRGARTKFNSAEHALNELQTKAKESKRKKDTVYIGVAVDAMATARTALEKLPSQPSAAM